VLTAVSVTAEVGRFDHVRHTTHGVDWELPGRYAFSSLPYTG
jgi:hypothetical protein